MKIESKTVTTHTGTFTAEEMKAVALSFARKQIPGADGAGLVSSAATVQPDGSVTVEIVVAAPDAAPSLPAAVEAPAVVEAPAAEVPVPAAAPHFVPGFGAGLKN